MDLYCTCGQPLEDSINRSYAKVEVGPCEKCLQAAKDEGYAQGKQDAES